MIVTHRLKEREDSQKKIHSLQEQAEELEYALKRLLETGTVISPELDERIQRAISNPNLLTADDFLDDDASPVCCYDIQFRRTNRLSMKRPHATCHSISFLLPRTTLLHPSRLDSSASEMDPDCNKDPCVIQTCCSHSPFSTTLTPCPECPALLDEIMKLRTQIAQRRGERPMRKYFSIAPTLYTFFNTHLRKQQLIRYSIPRFPHLPE